MRTMDKIASAALDINRRTLRHKVQAEWECPVSQNQEEGIWNAYFSISNEGVEVIIVTALIVIINPRFSQPASARENKPSGSFVWD